MKDDTSYLKEIVFGKHFEKILLGMLILPLILMISGKEAGGSEVYATIDENYTYGNYSGPFTPSPPHADNNPQRAVVVSWNDKDYKFVFWHEASYTPFWVLSDGTGLTYQYFEGEGDKSGDLWCANGRKEKYSHVMIVENGPERVWVRWEYSYFAMHGVEDYVFYPNGLCWRKMQLLDGIANEVFEMMILNPVGEWYWDNCSGAGNNVKLVTILDAYSTKRRREYYDNRSKSGVSKSEIVASQAVVFRCHLNELNPFAIWGKNTAFTGYGFRIIEIWDRWAYKAHFTHWPVGWVDNTSSTSGFGTYPTTVCPIGVDANKYITKKDLGLVMLLGVSDAPDNDLRILARKFNEAPDVTTNPDVVRDLLTPLDDTPLSVPGSLSAVTDGQRVDLTWTAFDDPKSGINSYKFLDPSWDMNSELDIDHYNMIKSLIFSYQRDKGIF